MMGCGEFSGNFLSGGKPGVSAYLIRPRATSLDLISLTKWQEWQ
jgi:hypothetical protein